MLVTYIELVGREESQNGTWPAAVSPVRTDGRGNRSATRRYETGLPELVTAGSAAGIRKVAVRDAVGMGSR